MKRVLRCLKRGVVVAWILVVIVLFITIIPLLVHYVVIGKDPVEFYVGIGDRLHAWASA